MIPNPPWSDKALDKNWDRIVSYADREGLPSPVPHEELGSGHYGAVYQSTSPGIVVKVTSDPTEYGFIQEANLIGQDEPRGIVRYYGMLKLDSSYRKRVLYAIWREEAEKVGLPWGGFGRATDYETRSLAKFHQRLNAFKVAASYARESLVKAKDSMKTWAEAKRYEERAWMDWDRVDAFQIQNKITFYRGGQRVAIALQIAHVLAELMENEYLADSVGGALGHFLENGFLLADVHSNNVGVVDRTSDEYDGGKPWVITDPGHVVVLPEGWQ